MRWPWDRQRASEQVASHEPLSAATVSPAGWASLPPLTPQLTPLTPTADLAGFPGARSAWSSPALTGQVQRQVAAAMPVLARPRPSDAASGAAPATGVAGLPVVSRVQATPRGRTARDAGPPPKVPGAPERGLTTSTGDHLPVLALPAAPVDASPAEPVADPDIHGPDALAELPPLQALPDVSAAPWRAAADSRRAIPSAAPGAALDQPPVALPVAVPRSATSPPGLGPTEVTIPDLEDTAPSSGRPASVAATPADQPTPPDRSVEGTPVQRARMQAPPGGTGQRLGLGAPLTPAPQAGLTAPPLPVVQRSTTTPATPAQPLAHSPHQAPGQEPGQTDSPSLMTAGPPTDAAPTPHESERESAHATDTAEPAPSLDSDLEESVEPDAPTAPAPLPLTLSRTVERPSEVGAGPPPGAGAHRDSSPGTIRPSEVEISGAPVLPPLPPTAALPLPPTVPPPLPTISRAVDREGPRGTGPAPEPRDALTPGAPGLGPHPPLVLAARDTARGAEVVVSRSRTENPSSRTPQLVDRQATRHAAPDHRTGDGADDWRSPPGPARPPVQRATMTTVRPEPTPVLQRLPGLSSLPGVVRARPPLPSGTPRMPDAHTLLTAGSPGSFASLPSLPTVLPPAPDVPGLSVTPPAAGPELPDLPMPVATARAPVAAISGASLPGRGTPSPADGSLAALPASAPPAAEATPPPATPEPAGVDATASAGSPSAAGVATSSGAAASTAGAASPQQIDELARRLYDPLASRLRAELLLDRERRGLRTDAW